ncbi:DinB family protein [Candidatus Sumerlaeota bacterium]|nr:DinB family protein [Candidatus Sumerlaeota bacterium]
MEQLTCMLDIVQHIVESHPAEDLTTLREREGGWTVTEVVGHLLDCERLFLERAQLTVTQDSPMLPFPPQDEEVLKGRYNEREPMDIVNDWREAREKFLAFLKTIPEEDWEREGRHPQYPPFSLNDQLFLASWHDPLHIRQITRILSKS